MYMIHFLFFNSHINMDVHIGILLSFYILPPLCTKGPLQFNGAKEFYVEGEAVDVNCINMNIAPFSGNPFWVDPMDMPVGTGGRLLLNRVTMSQAGLYTCHVTTINVQSPSRSLNVVVNCK